MKLSVGRYCSVLGFQITLIIVDICINTFSILLRKYNAALLVLFILQDVCLLLALATLLLTFFSTYVFQAGLVELLYDRFRVTIIVCGVYFILSTVVYIWMLVVRWGKPPEQQWSDGVHVFYVLQRLCAPFYYYFYKRASLRISDPRFYEDIDFEQKTSNANK